MMLKKKVNWQNKFRCAKKFFFGRAVEGSFLFKAGPKRGCFSYLITHTWSVVLHKSDVSFLIIAIRYENHPLFGPALDKNQPSTARPKKFFLDKNQLTFFLSIIYSKNFLPGGFTPASPFSILHFLPRSGSKRKIILSLQRSDKKWIP